MTCCTPTCQKWATFLTGLLLIFFGLILTLYWSTAVHSILQHQLTLENNETTEFKMWKETPIPMYTEFYLYNWTNWEDVQKDWSVKPKVQECGPYTYSEHHIREEIVFNDNDTLTYKTKRIWKFLPEKSVGSIDDQITTINPILVTIGYFVRFKHLIVQMGLNFFLEEFNYNLTVTQSVSTFIFDGYEDPMLDLAHKLNLSGFNIPFDKFGWFYERNESIDYDGSFTMYTGVGNLRKLGRMTLWNGAPRTDMYSGNCGMVNGTSGELWYPVEDDQSAQIFSPDLCSTLTLKNVGKYTKHGVQGYKFAGDDKNFDNGSKYPDMDCFSPGIPMPSGVRNISQCKFQAPAFVSYPHFYLADPYYLNAVEGMSPNKSKHELFMAIEPTSGIPLKVQAAVQVNLLIPQIKGINLLKNVKSTVLPVFWFKQSAELGGDLVAQAKLIIMLPSIGHYTGYGLLGIGILIIIVGIFVTYKEGWSKNSDREQLVAY